MEENNASKYQCRSRHVIKIKISEVLQIIIIIIINMTCIGGNMARNIVGIGVNSFRVISL